MTGRAARKALLRAASAESGLSEARILRALAAYAAACSAELAEGRSVPLPGLGRLRPSRRAARRQFVPGAGVRDIPARRAVLFKPSAALRAAVNTEPRLVGAAAQPVADTPVRDAGGSAFLLTDNRLAGKR